MVVTMQMCRSSTPIVIRKCKASPRPPKMEILHAAKHLAGNRLRFDHAVDDVQGLEGCHHQQVLSSAPFDDDVSHQTGHAQNLKPQHHGDSADALEQHSHRHQEKIGKSQAASSLVLDAVVRPPSLLVPDLANVSQVNVQQDGNGQADEDAQVVDTLEDVAASTVAAAVGAHRLQEEVNHPGEDPQNLQHHQRADDAEVPQQHAH
ncbi:hypothetical protein TYRP_019533 [Tyrophagus putrescentiae]|nr:hypothetical protein TYRP_019533 [Tyrophagus putrescentiae]